MILGKILPYPDVQFLFLLSLLIVWVIAYVRVFCGILGGGGGVAVITNHALKYDNLQG